MSVTTLLLLASSSPPRLLSKLLCNAITPCSSPRDSMAHGLRVWIGGVSARLPRGGQHAVHSNTTVLPSTTPPPLLLGCRACAVLLRWPGAEIGPPLSTLSHRTPLPSTGLATRSTRCSGRIYPFASFTMVRTRARAPPSSCSRAHGQCCGRFFRRLTSLLTPRAPWRSSATPAARSSGHSTPPALSGWPRRARATASRGPSTTGTVWTTVYVMVAWAAYFLVHGGHRAAPPRAPAQVAPKLWKLLK